MVPAVYFMATRFGAVGAAAVWLALNVLNLLLAAPLTHRRLLRNDFWEWVVKDVVVPALVAPAAAWGAHELVTIPESRLAAIVTLVAIFLAVFTFAAASATRFRPSLLGVVHRVPETEYRNRA
jgi:predicted permease